jgi:hypothetical protein
MAKGGKSDPVYKELEELRTRVLSLEQDNELLMDLAKNISKLFAVHNSPDDDKLEYKKSESKTLNVIVRNINKGALITPNHYAAIEKFSDLSVYSDADWFRKQLISAFENFYFNVNKVKAWELKFDEVKGYLADVSRMDDKAEFHVYVKNLKPK